MQVLLTLNLWHLTLLLMKVKSWILQQIFDMVNCLVIKFILKKLKKANFTCCSMNLWSYFCPIKSSRVQVWYRHKLLNMYLLLEKHTEKISSYPKLLTHKPPQLYPHGGSIFTAKLPLQTAPCDGSPSCLEEPHPFKHTQPLCQPTTNYTNLSVLHFFFKCRFPTPGLKWASLATKLKKVIRYFWL